MPVITQLKSQPYPDEVPYGTAEEGAGHNFRNGKPGDSTDNRYYGSDSRYKTIKKNKHIPVFF